MDNHGYTAIVKAASEIARITGRKRHDAVVVLGSGLGDYPLSLTDAIAVPYAEIPGFPQPSAVGHAGTAYSAEMAESAILLLSGRAHAYEGGTMAEIVFAVRTAIIAGCRSVVLTNACGGCGEGMRPGDLVVLSDHINLAGLSPLSGENDERLGPRFPDMTDVYTPHLRHLAHEAAADAGIVLRTGVYAWFHGPMYETPAEVEMARRLGADLVGMSTVPEAVAARHMSADVLGISLVTNLAAGLGAGRLSADEVIAMGAASAGRFGRLLDVLLPRL